MNEREKVAELINERFQLFRILNQEEVRPDIIKLADQIDALYSEREKKLREALEWACNELDKTRKCKSILQCISARCPIEQIKQAKEGK